MPQESATKRDPLRSMVVEVKGGASVGIAILPNSRRSPMVNCPSGAGTTTTTHRRVTTAPDSPLARPAAQGGERRTSLAELAGPTSG